ncbi:hypothetical protein B0H19DRAFT_1170955 [Mycena capillaripes]|nr:hypothetical protein B0H19DRAFT_1170955 [Mycena capillaripes]
MPRVALTAQQVRQWKLPLSELKGIIRAYENVSKLVPTVKSDASAITRILKDKITVDWAVIMATVLPDDVEAVDQFIHGLKGKGYTIVKVPAQFSSSPMDSLTDTDNEKPNGPLKVNEKSKEGVPGAEHDDKEKDSDPDIDLSPNATILVRVCMSKDTDTTFERVISFESQITIDAQGEEEYQASVDAESILKAWRESDCWSALSDNVHPDGKKRFAGYLFAMAWADGQEETLRMPLGFCWVADGMYKERVLELKVGVEWNKNRWETVLFAQLWKAVGRDERKYFPSDLQESKKRYFILHEQPFTHSKGDSSDSSDYIPDDPNDPDLSDHDHADSDLSDHYHAETNLPQIQGGHSKKRRRRGSNGSKKRGKLTAQEKEANTQKRQQKKRQADIQIAAALEAKYSEDQTVIEIRTLEKPKSSISCDLVRKYARKVAEITDDCAKLSDGTRIDLKHIVKFLARGKDWVGNAERIGHYLSKYRKSKDPLILPWLNGEPSAKLGMSSFCKKFRKAIKKSGEADSSSSSDSGSESESASD